MNDTDQSTVDWDDGTLSYVGFPDGCEHGFDGDGTLVYVDHAAEHDPADHIEWDATYGGATPIYDQLVSEQKLAELAAPAKRQRAERLRAERLRVRRARWRAFREAWPLLAVAVTVSLFSVALAFGWLPV